MFHVRLVINLSVGRWPGRSQRIIAHDGSEVTLAIWAFWIIGVHSNRCRSTSAPPLQHAYLIMHTRRTAARPISCLHASLRPIAISRLFLHALRLWCCHHEIPGVCLTGLDISACTWRQGYHVDCVRCLHYVSHKTTLVVQCSETSWVSLTLSLIILTLDLAHTIGWWVHLGQSWQVLSHALLVSTFAILTVHS